MSHTCSPNNRLLLSQSALRESNPQKPGLQSGALAIQPRAQAPRRHRRSRLTAWHYRIILPLPVVPHTFGASTFKELNLGPPVHQTGALTY